MRENYKNRMIIELTNKAIPLQILNRINKNFDHKYLCVYNQWMKYNTETKISKLNYSKSHHAKLQKAILFKQWIMINLFREDKIKYTQPRRQKIEINSLTKINYSNPKIK